jgi:hypothetical protein
MSDIIPQVTSLFQHGFAFTKDLSVLLSSLLSMFGVPPVVIIANISISVSHIILLVLVVASFFLLLKVFPVVIKTYLVWFCLAFVVVVLLIILSSFSMESIQNITENLNLTLQNTT